MSQTLTRTSSSSFTPSPYQEAIFNWVESGKGNCFVNAVAGSGKTTTILRAMDRIPASSPVLYLVFSKDMADSVKKRGGLHPNLTCGTTHSYGFRELLRNFKGLRVDQYKVGNLLRDQVRSMPWKHYQSLSAFTVSTIGDWKNKGLIPAEIVPDHVERAIADYCDERDADYKFLGKHAHNTVDVFHKCVENITSVDFNDMLWLPVVLDLPIVSPEWVFVDEAQDLNPCQILFLQRMKRDSRFLFVGDPHQSIFAFRGADENAIPKIAKSFQCQEFPLSVTYRCSKAVTKAAQKYVPHLEHAPTAEEGEVRKLPLSQALAEMKPSDMVLCRNIAPLVDLCVRFIKQKKPATVLGTDIGKKLKKLWNEEVAPFLDGDAYEAIETGRAVAMARFVRHEDQERADRVSDSFEALRALTPGASATTSDVETKIDTLFSDQKATYTFSSIHRAKGQEANHVYLLAPTRPITQHSQELNLQYVALTRAKKTFTYIVPDETL